MTATYLTVFARAPWLGLLACVACAELDTSAPETPGPDAGYIYDGGSAPGTNRDGGGVSPGTGGNGGNGITVTGLDGGALSQETLDALQGLFGGGDGGPIDPGPGGELDPNGAVNPQLPPKSDNAPECPSLAPPNPVGGCLGLPIYVICGYGEEGGGGPQYTCTCDWYHWLCV